VTSPYSDKVLRLRGAAVLFWLLPKEDGKRDLRALPLKIPFKGEDFSSWESISAPLKLGGSLNSLKGFGFSFLGGDNCGF